MRLGLAIGFGHFAYVFGQQTPIANLGQSLPTLWPMPRHLESGHSILKLAEDFEITVFKGAPTDLVEAIEQTLQYLFQDKHQVGIASP